MNCPMCHGQRFLNKYFPCPECGATGTISCCGDQGACMTIPEEFDCIDCNAHVFAYTGAQQRCLVCQWIHDRPDLTEKEIAEIRVITATPIYNIYENNNYPTRECDRCGKLYKGPAVYCSHKCAMEDA